MRFALLLCLVGGATAGLLRADWRTFGGNPQRDGWSRDETTLTRENVKGLKLEWKLHLDNVTREMNSLTPPLVVEKLVTPRGFKDAVVVAGGADTLYAIDTDTGQLMWERKFSAEGKPRFAPSFLCPGALNDTPAISNQFWGWTVYVIASDGKLHSVNAVDGEDRLPPIQFVPPYSKNWSLNLAGGELYTGLSQGCDFAKSAVYALALNDPKHAVKSFQASASGAGIWGRAGVAISPEGVVYAETGDGLYDEKKGNFPDSFLAISSHDLKLLDYYTPLNRAYLTHKDLDMGCISPLVFPFKQWELVAGGGKEGVLYLLDAKSLGGTDHRTPLFRSPRYTNQEVNLAGRGFWGALATWADTQEVRWLYAPAWGPQDSGSPEFPTTYGSTPNGSIMAFKVEVKDGKPVLAPAWRSRDLAVPEPPIIANGVVYALSNGENVQSIHESGRLLTSAERIATHPGNAVLYAFDAQTGKELYSSGKTIPGFTHMSGLAIANGHIYVATFDNTVYSFGLGTEQ
jgi:outer membrane protein assembly factor BamB